MKLHIALRKFHQYNPPIPVKFNAWFILLLLVLMSSCATVGNESAEAKRYAALLFKVGERYCLYNVASRSVLRSAVNSAIAPYSIKYEGCPVSAVDLEPLDLDLGRIQDAIKIALATYCGYQVLKPLIEAEYEVLRQHSGSDAKLLLGCPSRKI